MQLDYVRVVESTKYLDLGYYRVRVSLIFAYQAFFDTFEGVSLLVDFPLAGVHFRKVALAD